MVLLLLAIVENPRSRRLYSLVGLGIVAAMGTGLWAMGPGSCTLRAWAHAVQTYGSAGRSGMNGRPGVAGTPGPSRAVWAEGQPQQVILVGGDGQGGEAGDRGGAAHCPSQPRDVRYDLQGARGGDGGNGGPGGNGGDGGALTLYYDNPAALGLIVVDNRGGRGGVGGWGGEGGEGCRCRIPEWQIQTCSGTPGTSSYRCEVQRFFCRDGERGRPGRNGASGQTGAMGSVWLVNQREPLLPELPQVRQSLASPNPAPVQLSKNRWRSRSGLTALLAPGSQVADTYQEFWGRVEGRGQLVWQAERAAVGFSDMQATFTLEDSGVVSVSFPESLWVLGSATTSGDLTTYTVTHAVRREEATRMALGTASGSGANWTLAILDLAGVSDWVNTQFQIRIRTAEAGDGRGPVGDHRPPRYFTRYEGVLPANTVSRDHNRFILALGRLPLQGSARSGDLLEVEVTPIRSLGPHQAQQTLTWRGEVP